ncbi:Helix-turn-helix domain-containing protein [Blastococcus sp. DSM 46786]|uniref:helix-turn-helix domain-containing protein n=1 Tax=Blastococcus sp. DSM 46786 TaxID=1798227 RepID=UPI0008B5EADD|nr:cupin domain-containing protein [Blastococcus sp. DSM 46786]SEL61900.1 Helix-turn-helix domain-containing protein [Blastococcus sp. DSM 46786]
MAGELRRPARPHEPAAALIGARLRAARQTAGLTLAAVAEQAGLTKGFLSRLERDEVSPSVASLVTVCGVLGIGVGQLFEPPETSLVRAGEAPPINFGGAGLHEQLLTAGTQRQLQVIRSVVDPGGGGGPELYSLACDVEFVYVVAGELRLTLPGETVDLAAGDAFTMPGATPHTWFNPSATCPAEVLWALTPAP